VQSRSDPAAQRSKQGRAAGRAGGPSGQRPRANHLCDRGATCGPAVQARSYPGARWSRQAAPERTTSAIAERPGGHRSKRKASRWPDGPGAELPNEQPAESRRPAWPPAQNPCRFHSHPAQFARGKYTHPAQTPTKAAKAERATAHNRHQIALQLRNIKPQETRKAKPLNIRKTLNVNPNRPTPTTIASPTKKQHSTIAHFPTAYR
jgi:hypothetical protein